MVKSFSRILVLAAAAVSLSTQADATVVYANSVVGAGSTGITVTNTAIDSARLLGASALGSATAVVGQSTGFYSLGFGGSITLGFSGLIGAGTATFYETTGAGLYPKESADVFLFDIASNAFVFAGSVNSQPTGPNGTLSFANLCAFGCSYLKIVDTSKKADFNGFPLADGYDVNAVSVSLLDPQLTNSVPEPGTLALLGLGLAGLSIARKRKA